MKLVKFTRNGAVVAVAPQYVIAAYPAPPEARADDAPTHIYLMCDGTPQICGVDENPNAVIERLNSVLGQA